MICLAFLTQYRSVPDQRSDRSTKTNWIGVTKRRICAIKHLNYLHSYDVDIPATDYINLIFRLTF